MTVRICAGKINDWLLIDREVGFVIVGTIEGDAYYRSPDGRFIQTSLLKPGQLVAAGELIRTYQPRVSPRRSAPAHSDQLIRPAATR